MLIHGSYKTTSAGYQAFIPDPLPPHLKLNTRTYSFIEETMFLLGKVNGLKSFLPYTEILIYKTMQAEAIASSTIENTIASPDELILYQRLNKLTRNEVKEVANYAEALRYGQEVVKSGRLDLALIKDLHEILLRDVRGNHSAGQFKEKQNFIGRSEGGELIKAIYIPPSPEDMPELLENLEWYLNTPQSEPRLVQCALAHYQFETIHPFGDGNGRIGRLLVILHLMKLGLINDPVIHPSVFFEKTRDEYYSYLKTLQSGREDCWEDWILYFVGAVKSQCESALDFVQQMQTLQVQLRDLPFSHVEQASAQSILNAFFRDPVLSVNDLIEQTRYSKNTILARLRKMKQLGLVEEIAINQKHRVFKCVPVFDRALKVF